MKNFITPIICLFVLMLGFTSCSEETGESLGKDAINNIIRSGKWTEHTSTVWVGSAEGLTSEMLKGEGDYLEFTNKDKVWFYDVSEDTGHAVSYRLLNTKTMEYDGVEYEIQERILGSISQITLIHVSGDTKTQIIFKR